MSKEIDLNGKGVTGDKLIESVIDAKAKIERMARELAAIKKDRDQLLDEYTDMRQARPVPVAPPPKTRQDGAFVRVDVGDIHGMRMDKKAVAAFLADLKQIMPNEIVIGGDLVECGGWLAKHQPIGYVASADYTYQEDIAAANWFLDQVQGIVPDAAIHYIEGNHEDRVERWIIDQTMSNARDAEFLLDAFSPQALLRLPERNIQYYRRSATYVEGLPPGWIKLGKLFYTHTLGTGKNAARAAVEKTAGNVVYFCTHREDTATVVLPGVGMVKAFNPGCMCVRQPLWRHSDPTSWSHGYGITMVTQSGNFQRIHVPIWNGESLGGAIKVR